MKIYEIWGKIKDEPKDVQDMVISALNGQLEEIYKYILNEEVKKLGVVYNNNLIADYNTLISMCAESLDSSGLNNHSNLMLYRELIFSVLVVQTKTQNKYGKPTNNIDIEAFYKDGTQSQAVNRLLRNIMVKIYESEFIDIDYFI